MEQNYTPRLKNLVKAPRPRGLAKLYVPEVGAASAANGIDLTTPRDPRLRVQRFVLSRCFQLLIEMVIDQLETLRCTSAIVKCTIADPILN